MYGVDKGHPEMEALTDALGWSKYLRKVQQNQKGNTDEWVVLQEFSRIKWAEFQKRGAGKKAVAGTCGKRGLVLRLGIQG